MGSIFLGFIYHVRSIGIMAFVLGILGDSGVGKDTVANFVMSYVQEKTKLTVAKHNWAAALKETTHDLFGHLGVKDEAYYDTAAGRVEREIIIPELNMTVVDLWVSVGEYMRTLCPNVWVDLVKLRAKEDFVICAGTRHLNEVGVSDVTIRVTNSRIPKRTGKSIDHILDNVETDFTIENESTLEVLRNLSRDVAEQIIRENFK